MLDNFLFIDILVFYHHSVVYMVKECMQNANPNKKYYLIRIKKCIFWFKTLTAETSMSIWCKSVRKEQIIFEKSEISIYFCPLEILILFSYAFLGNLILFAMQHMANIA